MTPTQHSTRLSWFSFGFYNGQGKREGAGRSIYVITSPEEAQTLYKNTITLSWARYVQNLYGWIGMPKNNIEKLWPSTPTEKPNGFMPAKHSTNQKLFEYRHHHLLPGESLDELSQTFRSYLDKELQWQSLTAGNTYLRESSSDWIKISLLDWTTQTFIGTITEIYWGKSMFRIAPQLIESLRKWERCSWKHLYDLPSFLKKDTDAAKNNLLGGFTTYFGLPKSQRQDAMNPVAAVEGALRSIDFNDNDIAKVNMLWHWAINGNLHKVSFWMFAHLLYNPQILQLVLEEVAAGMANGAPDMPYLTEQCPWMEAVFHEVLRLTAGSSLMRDVTENTVIGGKILKKGNKVMVQYRQLHFSEGAWGSNFADFDPARFIKKKYLSRSSSFRPFGGGQHLCPGRFLARQVIFAFVALTLSRYDIRLANGEKSLLRFPRVDESRPGLGTLPPVVGDEVIIQLSPRKL
ncbi:MAG: hypothetical protein Q9217_006254 [Psora testacea]